MVAYTYVGLWRGTFYHTGQIHTQSDRADEKYENVVYRYIKRLENPPQRQSAQLFANEMPGASHQWISSFSFSYFFIFFLLMLMENFRFVLFSVQTTACGFAPHCIHTYMLILDAPHYLRDLLIHLFRKYLLVIVIIFP